MEAVLSQCTRLENESDDALLNRARNLRTRLAVSGPSRDLTVEGFALVREAVRRKLGITYHDVQLLAGLSLARGEVAEMGAGEGKTVVAALPAFMHGLSGRGVHIVTVNRYLAKRDYRLLQPVYASLGLAAGLIEESAPPPEKRVAYAADITYGVGYEFGFDYLRDQIALHTGPGRHLGERLRSTLKGHAGERPATVQRALHFAIVDEIDSVLIDEARTPLVLSLGTGKEAADAEVYARAAERAGRLVAGDDYVVDRVAGRVYVTEKGLRKLYGADAPIPGRRLARPWTEYVENALRANSLLIRDVHYVVSDRKVFIVDAFTGRRYTRRSWQEGLHQAVQAKEGVTVTPEDQAVARITRQRYFSMYERLAGMTGTARGSERELWQFYRVAVALIPPQSPCRRKALPPRAFKTLNDKWAAIADDAHQAHLTGQPVLVGTKTVEDSEAVARRLGERRVPFRLLNAKQDEEEASIIGRAGEKGAVTIATNMAGRGADIRLGEGVEKTGGLHVMAAERHESSRIDRQLIGRCARQGAPGMYRFYVSLEDPLITLYAPYLKRRRYSTHNDGRIGRDLSRALDRAQRRAENHDFETRWKMFRYDQWLEQTLERMAREEHYYES